MDETLHTALSRWTEFYLITGGAAAALTGLQFVVQTLIASESLVADPDEDAIAAFGSPTVVHFSLAMVLSAMMCVPWPSYLSLRTTLGAVGAGAVIYSVIVLRRARRQEAYVPGLEDWLWHVVFPSVAYVALLAGAVAEVPDAQWPLFAIAGATLVLLSVGIHNAWDTVTYLTLAALRRPRRTGGVEPPAPASSATSAAAPASRAPASPDPAGARGTTMPDVIVRPALPQDVPAMGRLGELLVREHHEFDPARFIAASPDTAAGYGNFLGSQLAKPDVSVLVAEINGQVAGYTYAGVEGRDYMALRDAAGALYDVVVDPAYRDHGVGRALVDAALAALTARGAPRVVLSTAEQNDSAKRLFTRAGFRRTMIEMTRELGSQQLSGGH